MTDTAGTTPLLDELRDSIEWGDIFRADGTIHIPVDDTTHVLRVPKFREIRSIRQGARDQAAVARDRAARGDAVRTELRAMLDVGENVPIPEQRDGASAEEVALRVELLDLSDSATMEWLAWWHDVVFPTLAAPPLPDGSTAEDLPLWLANADLVRRMNLHWSSVPRRPGVK